MGRARKHPPQSAAVEALERRALLAGQISGSVYNDLNANGVRDAGEPGVSDVMVFLDANFNNRFNGGETFTATNVNGGYSFNPVDPGTAHLAIVTPDNWEETSPSPGKLLVDIGGGITEFDPVTGAPLRKLNFDEGSGSAVGDALGPGILYHVRISTSGPPSATITPVYLSIGSALPPQGHFSISTPSNVTGAGYLNGKLYLACGSSDQVVVWDVATRAIAGTLSVAANIGDGFTGCSDDGLLYASGASFQNVFAIDPATGVVVRTLTLSSMVSGGGLAFVNGQLLASTTNSRIIRFNPLTGAALGTINLSTSGTVSALSGDGSAQRTIAVQDGLAGTGVDFGVVGISAAPTGIAWLSPSALAVYGIVPGSYVRIFDAQFSDPIASGITDSSIALVDTSMHSNSGYFAYQTEPGKLPSAFSPFYSTTPGITYPYLARSSDTGFSADDLITAGNTPTITGVANNGEAITIFSDGVAVGSGVGGNDGAFSITTSPLAPGTHTITMQNSFTTGIVGLKVTILAPSPSVVSTIYNYNTPALSFQFDRSTQGTITADALLLHNMSTNTSLTLPPLAVSYALSTNLATFAFTGNGLSLADGNYVALLLAAKVADAGGNPLTHDEGLSFFILHGDANGDRFVNALDFNAVASHFGASVSGQNNGDFNFDGKVNSLDFTALATNFNLNLPVNAPAPPALASSVRLLFDLEESNSLASAVL